MLNLLYRTKVLKDKLGNKRLLITFTALNNYNRFNGLIEKIYYDDYLVNETQIINIIKNEMLALDYHTKNYNFININELIFKGL